MPNWCSNTLEVRGDKEQLKEFIQKSVVASDHNSPEHYDFTFEGLFPTPKELTEMTSPVAWGGDETDVEGKKEFEAYVKELEQKYHHSDWYSWRVANWGCKWDCSSSYIAADDGEVFVVSYDTAWSPNIEWTRKVSQMFPDLEFRLIYMEPGVGFCGVATIENGEVYDEGGDIVWTDEDGEEVEYDSSKNLYKYIKTGEVIEDEDFYPFEHNPFDY
jgi:hypothetical protein